MIALTNPIAVEEVTSVEVRAVKFEQNIESGQIWVELWCDFGYLDGGILKAYPIPQCGQSSTLYLKFENGYHPLRPSMALGQCNVCNAWGFKISGPCDCGGTFTPYEAYTALATALSLVIGVNMIPAIEQHLVSTELPDPDDIENIHPLVDGAV